MKFIYLSDRKCLYGADVYIRDASHVFRLVLQPVGECYVPVTGPLAAQLNAMWRK